MCITWQHFHNNLNVLTTYEYGSDILFDEGPQHIWVNIFNIWDV